jgi:hypothetical protein
MVLTTLPANDTGRQPGRELLSPGPAGSPVTVTDSTTTAVALFVPSLAAMVKVVEGVTPVGVPEITPDEVFIESPAGNAGVIAKVREDPKVVEVNAVVAVRAVPTRPTTVCVAGMSCPEALIVTRTVATPKFVPSETISTCVVSAFTSVGVPVIAPVVTFKARPAGSAGVIENDLVPVTAGAEMVDVGVIATPTNPTSNCAAGETAVAGTDAEVTVIDTVAVADAVPSDTVMV